MKEARILWERGEYRLVEAKGVYHVEKRGEADAMGIVAWRKVDSLHVEWPRHPDEDDADITIPKEVFRGMCERIKLIPTERT